MEVPHATPPTTPIEPHAGRFSSTVRPIAEFKPSTLAPRGKKAVAILGMPDDTGVKLNGGRPGAKEGPGAIRAALARMGVDKPADFDWPAVYDAGDVLPAGEGGEDLDTTHDRISEASGALARAGLIPIGLGGGHDLTFAFVRGVIDALPKGEKPLTGFYADPHLDVRDTPGSGMAFRKLITDCGVKKLINTGYDTMLNTKEHKRFFNRYGGLSDTEQTAQESMEEPGPYFVSFDMDFIDAAFAPGVSAANPCGWSSIEAQEWLRSAVGYDTLRCLDIMELNPAHDEGGRTARLAARLLLTALKAIANPDA